MPQGFSGYEKDSGRGVPAVSRSHCSSTVNSTDIIYRWIAPLLSSHLGEAPTKVRTRAVVRVFYAPVPVFIAAHVVAIERFTKIRQ